MKLSRGAFRTFLDGAKGRAGLDNGGKAPDETARQWNIIGVDIEEMNMTLSPSIESKQNILDETSVVDKGYEPSEEATPYYADTTDPLYEMLRDIALGRKVGDDCKTTMLEVLIEKTDAPKHLAYIEDCYVKPSSYGGDTSGFAIPFTIRPSGNRIKGTVTIDAIRKHPVFTPDAGQYTTT